MSENVLQTVQQLVQDVIAPDVRELKVRVAQIEKQIESLKNYIDARFTAQDDKTDIQFRALLAAISESRAQAELSSMRVIAALSERVAILESQRH